MMKALASLSLPLVFATSAYSFPKRTITSSLQLSSINTIQSQPISDKKPFTISRISSARPNTSQKKARTTQPIKAKQTIKPLKRNVLALRPMRILPTDPVEVSGRIIDFTSANQKMISFRHQYHMWETADNALHVLLNRGGTGTGNGLVLYTSSDQGQTWNASVSVPNTNSNSTSDGFIKGNKLYIAASTSNGFIQLSTFNYDSNNQQWSNAQSSTIFVRQGPLIGSNPTIVEDANGVFWATLVTSTGTSSSASVSFKLYRSTDQGQNWADAGVAFGATSNSFKRSARLLALGDRVGVVYTTNTTNSTNIFWASRLNSDDTNATWQDQLIFQFPSSDNDPAGSHFSAVTDTLGNIHMATRINGRLLYLKYKADLQRWEAAKYLSGFLNVAYTQVTTSPDNQIYIVFNSGSDVSVLKSTDNGTTFVTANNLVKPDVTGLGVQVDWTTPRVLVPQLLLNPEMGLSVFRQFVLDGVQRLSYY